MDLPDSGIKLGFSALQVDSLPTESILIHCHLASTNGDSEQGGGETGIPQSLSLQPGLEVALTVKNLPAMQKTWVQSLDREDPLEKGMATYSSILGWRIPWQRSLTGSSPWVCKGLDTTE